MARLMSKLEIELIMWSLIIGLPIYGITLLGKSIGWEELAGGTIAVIGLIAWYTSAKKKKRRDRLMAKYQDAALVEKLMSHSFWQGQTSDQLRDSLGAPVDIDEKVLKTKRKEVWKYEHEGGNRYRLRIMGTKDIGHRT